MSLSFSNAMISTNRRGSTSLSLGALILTLFAGCSDREATTSPAPTLSTTLSTQGSIESIPLTKSIQHHARSFVSLSPEQTGIDFLNRFDWGNKRKNLYQHGYAGGGVCIGDYDGDGKPDIYLVSQVGRDRLYRQVGNLKFEDVTDAAGIDSAINWGTGAIFADINNDGQLDLYVCNYDAPNKLYINQGDGTFIESATSYGLDFHGASIMAGFADYDLDGDLDLYLLTNRLYPGPTEDIPKTQQVNGKVQLAPGLEEMFFIQQRNINGELQKFIVKAGQRDYLYRNDGNGSFIDVSKQAGISGNHPGLSATWWDYDNDGWPDLYVCNDFWDADRLYHNNKDGTFTDMLAEALPHTPWFSMGADFADINNDGLFDFLAADMSATTHFMSKLMMGDMNESRWFLESAQPRQYMRNALYLNTGTDRFMEIGFLSNLASTDWTWSVKFGDLDNDGLNDVFFTNGTANHSFDPDLTRKLRSAARQRNTDPVTAWETQWEIFRTVEPRREENLVFKNEGDLHFENKSKQWGLDKQSISFGAAYSDLDRDGDLDLVVSNIDDPVSIYRNDVATSSSVLIRLVGSRSNRFGIGATITIKTGEQTQVRQLSPTRGYMSANEPIIHFGLGDNVRIDSLTISWPSGEWQQFEQLDVDRFYKITEPGKLKYPTIRIKQHTQFSEISSESGLMFSSKGEQPFDDYKVQPLLPAKLSQLGPGLAWGDADGDGDDDLFVGGSAGFSGALFINNGNGKFKKQATGPWINHKACEDMGQLWIDVDGDGDMDLYVASGSYEFEIGDPRLRDRLYLNQGGGKFVKSQPGALPDVSDCTSVVVAGDYDHDGDLDLFVGARVIPGQYPLAPTSRLLRNDKGIFVDVTDIVAPGLDKVGLVTSALWSDADNDGLLDLFVTLEWGPISFWRNTGKGLENQTQSSGLADRTGWYNSITGSDLDNDGDIDYIVMNAGLNNKYHASQDKPALLYYGDFQGSGRKTLVEAKPGENDLLPIRGLSCSSEAMPFVKQKLPTYRAFASASLSEIYADHNLGEALVFKATELQSGILINQGVTNGHVRFAFKPLPHIAQASPGYGVVASDFDGNGNLDIYFVQNFFEREPETGRWDGGLSLLLLGNGQCEFEPINMAYSGLVVPGDATGATICDINNDGRPDLAVTRNNDTMLIFENDPLIDDEHDFLAVRLVGAKGNPTAIGSRVTLIDSNGKQQTQEIYAGSGYLSQSSSQLFFGTGKMQEPLELHIRWPDGKETIHKVDIATKRIVLNHYGK
ncbi:MAG: VCBS repeat-containing protein [Planctomycetes bacterium]|nr:VCBS repeat-containing protein [Planctomycetota bacterium]